MGGRDPDRDGQNALADAMRDVAAALSSTLDLDEVLDRILMNIERVVPHDTASIMLVEDGVAHFVRARGYAERGLAEWLAGVRLPLLETANLQHMAESGQPLCIPDTHADPHWIKFPETESERSYAGAPIRFQDRTIGFLNLTSNSPNFYNQRHAENLQAFADQAAIAIENARLYQETRQRLIAQAAFLRATQAISSSLDLPTALNRCAEQLCRALDATSASIRYWNRNDNSTTVVAEYYEPGSSAGERQLGPGSLAPGDEAAWLADGQPLIRYTGDLPIARSMGEQPPAHDVQSLLFVPLRAQNQAFGYAVLRDSRRRREFSTDEIQLCQGIAQQAANAFENARLYEAARQQLVMSRILQAVGALLTAEMSLNEVFERLFDLLAEAIHYDCVSIELFDEHDQVYLAAQRGLPDPDQARQVTRQITGPSIRERWGQHSVSVVPDTQSDPRWLRVPEFGFIRSRVLVWLRVKNRIFGILNVDSKTANTYDAASGETVAAFANQAAIAIENAQLSEAIRRHAAILEQHVAERTAELDQERQRRQAILDAAGEGIIFTDVNGVIEYMNPAMEQLTGYFVSEVSGQTSRLWKSNLTPDTVYDEMWDTIRRGKVWKGEMINRHKTGRLYDTALTVTPLRGAEHQIIGFVGIERDVSHQKELDRLKDQFVSNVSHEFRTPLANMKLYLNLLERGRPEKREQYMQTLQRETARLDNLIEDLLFISRLGLGAATARNIPTDLHPLIVQLITDRWDLAARHSLSVDYLPQPDLPSAMADAGLFSQVMSNLIDNAINYTPAGGIVTIAADVCTVDRQDWITVVVQDTGPGISDEDMPHIFERFYRGEAARKSGAPGTGLGLSICQQVAEKMDGRLTVESKPGEGAAFTLWLRPAPG